MGGETARSHSNMSSSIQAAIIGARGYVGGELLHCLARHPQVGGVIPCSASAAGSPVAEAHPRLAGSELKFAAAVPADAQVDAVFFATPPRVAMAEAGRWLAAGAKVFDCSPDFRLKDLGVWEKWYGEGHASPELAAKSVYGLVEHAREEIAGADLVAVPGCYATAIQLAAVPVARALAAAGQEVSIVADCVSGTSGAGRSAGRDELLLAEAGGNYQAYALAGHRHSAEILQGLAAHAACPGAALRFVPHLLPLPRGMFATLHFIGAAEVDVHAALAAAYKDEALVEVLAAGRSPQLAAVTGTARAQLGAAGSVGLCAIDNLGKGAAGQAVQACNVAFGFSETAGLPC
ncbi:MAG: N-acetyl-gamma-glutamyl-phosphate reductase [Betaproteobacteria bacterium AqS2]|uniref:N-acetyl-gamma-glutamyl-phosphate reductase n=1 Tax=Candidatus Amphirhobacter heronislandensis TaxID=1732024 RepID=A0A930Y348_9GAMM|nr:N-acetyl-gamma-glutamyl-phosphate reductase [Betaproteobacteria bacterium AqS2]